MQTSMLVLSQVSLPLRAVGAVGAVGDRSVADDIIGNILAAPTITVLVNAKRKRTATVSRSVAGAGLLAVTHDAGLRRAAGVAVLVAAVALTRPLETSKRVALILAVLDTVADGHVVRAGVRTLEGPRSHLI